MANDPQGLPPNDPAHNPGSVEEAAAQRAQQIASGPPADRLPLGDKFSQDLSKMVSVKAAPKPGMPLKRSK